MIIRPASDTSVKAGRSRRAAAGMGDHSGLRRGTTESRCVLQHLRVALFAAPRWLGETCCTFRFRTMSDRSPAPAHYREARQRGSRSATRPHGAPTSAHGGGGPRGPIGGGAHIGGAPHFAMGGQIATGLTEPRCVSERGLAMGGGRPAESRFTVGGSGKSVARCHRTVPGRPLSGREARSLGETSSASDPLCRLVDSTEAALKLSARFAAPWGHRSVITRTAFQARVLEVGQRRSKHAGRKPHAAIGNSHRC